jgi:hypothetical protein
VLETFLGPKSPHTARFKDLSFYGAPIISSDPFGPGIPTAYLKSREAEKFLEGCKAAEATLQAAIRDIEDFGVHTEQPEPATPPRRRGRSGGGVNQHFYGPATIHGQAIATDNATQSVGAVGDQTGASLDEIYELLRQSEELTPREVREAAEDIVTLTIEAQKPEPQRDWKSILDCAGKVLGLVDKARDLAGKLALHTPALNALVDKAKHLLG